MKLWPPPDSVSPSVLGALQGMITGAFCSFVSHQAAVLKFRVELSWTPRVDCQASKELFHF